MNVVTVPPSTWVKFVLRKHVQNMKIYPIENFRPTPNFPSQSWIRVAKRPEILVRNLVSEMRDYEDVDTIEENVVIENCPDEEEAHFDEETDKL